MANQYSIRSRDAQPYDFVDGVAIKGVDISARDGTKTIGLQLPNGTLGTLYDWLVSVKARLQTSQTTLPFATAQEAIAGATAGTAISPAILKQALASLVGITPAELDSLVEFQSAIGNDPNLATTIQTQLSQKASLLGAALSGTPQTPTPANASNKDQAINLEYLQAAIAAALLSLKPAPTQPVLVGDALALIGSSYTLNMSSVADPTLSVDHFEVQVNGGAAQNVPATNGAAVFTWPATGVNNTTVSFTVVAVDTGGRPSQSAASNATLTDLAIVAPTIVSPQDGISAVRPHPIIALGAFSSPFQTETHASTSWVLTNTATGLVDYQSLNNTSALTQLQVPDAVLKNSTQYRLDVTFHSTAGHSSATSTSHFVTIASAAAPSAGGNNYILPDSNLNLGISITVSDPLDVPNSDPFTTSPHAFYYRIDGGPLVLIPNPIISNNGLTASASASLTPADFAGLSGVVPVEIMGYMGYTGLTLATTLNITVVAYTAASFLFPTNNQVDVPIRPTFTIGTYTSNLAQDQLTSATWSLKDVLLNVVVDSVTAHSAANKNSWAPTVVLGTGVEYELTCTQYGDIIQGVSPAPIRFTTTTMPESRTPNLILNPTVDTANDQLAGFSIATNASGTRLLMGIPMADWTSSGTTYTDVGLSEIVNVSSSSTAAWLIDASGSINGTSLHQGLVVACDAFCENYVQNARTTGVLLSTGAGILMSQMRMPVGSVSVGASGINSLSVNADGTVCAIGYPAGVQFANVFLMTIQTRPDVLAGAIPQDPLSAGMTLVNYAESCSLSADGLRLAVSLRWGNTTNSLTGFAVYDYNTTTGQWSAPIVKYGELMGVWNLPTELSASNWMQMSYDGQVIALGCPCKLPTLVGKGLVQVWTTATATGQTGESWLLEQSFTDARADAVDGGFFGYSLSISFNGAMIAVGAYSFQNAVNAGRGDLIIRASATSGAWRQMNHSYVANATTTNAQVGSSMALSLDGHVLFLGAPKQNSKGAVLGWYLTESAPLRDYRIDSLTRATPP